MSNLVTDSMVFSVPQSLDGAPFSIKHDLSAEQIELAVLPPREQYNFKLGGDEVLRPNFWGTQEQDHETTPAPVYHETNVAPALSEGEQKAAEMANLNNKERADYILTMGPYVMTARHIALHANPN